MRGPGLAAGTTRRRHGASGRRRADRAGPARAAGPHRRRDRDEPGGEPGHGRPAGPAGTTYAESLTPLMHYQWSDLRVLREGPWKYILAPRPELYDLASDPGETRDLSTANTATARRLRAALEGLLRAERERALATDAGPGRPVGRGPAEAWRARLRQPRRRQGHGGAGRRPEGQDRRVPDAERADARGADAAPAEALRRERGQARPSCAGRRRQLPGALLPGPGPGRPRPVARGRRRTSSGRSPPCPASPRRISSLAEARLARAIRAARSRPCSAGSATPRTSRSCSIARASCGSSSATPRGPWPPTRRWRRWRPRTPSSGGAWASCCSASSSRIRRWRMFREATALDPTVADYWNSLGMVLGGAGQHDEAARRVHRGDDAGAEERALRLQPRPGADARRQARGAPSGSAARWRSIRRSDRRGSVSRNWRDDSPPPRRSRRGSGEQPSPK